MTPIPGIDGPGMKPARWGGASSAETSPAAAQGFPTGRAAEEVTGFVRELVSEQNSRGTCGVAGCPSKLYRMGTTSSS